MGTKDDAREPATVGGALDRPLGAREAAGARQLTAVVQAAMASQRIPGVALAIVHRGRVEFTGALGVTDLAAPSALGVDTRFPCSSMTKSLVAAAVMQLVEAGRLDLDAPVVERLPYFRLADPRASRITPLHLLTHTAGIPDDDPYTLYDRPEHDEGALERYVRSLASRPLAHHPGERYAYSNAGYEVLGDLVAKLRGQPLEEAVAACLLRPLGMKRATLRPLGTDPDQAAGHTLDEAGEVVPSGVRPYTRAHAASGMLAASLLDMTRWLGALLGNGAIDGVRILEAASVDRMFTPTVATGRADGTRAALGLRIGEHRGQRTVGHGGLDVGFQSGFLLLPDASLGAVVLTSFFWSATATLLRAAVDVALGRAPEPLEPDDDLGAPVGAFEARDGTHGSVERRGDDLCLVFGGRVRRLTRIDAMTFVVSERDGSRPVFVRRGDPGEVVDGTHRAQLFAR